MKKQIKLNLELADIIEQINERDKKYRVGGFFYHAGKMKVKVFEVKK